MPIMRRLISSALRLPSRILERSFEARQKSRLFSEKSSRIYRTAWVSNARDREAITLGNNCHIHGSLQTMGHGGVISIGDNFFLGPNSKICSAARITIGNRVLVSHGVNIFDTNSHSLSAQLRAEHFAESVKHGQPKTVVDIREAEIRIEDDVWIGFGAAIMKGVTLGRGSVVAAGSVVTNSVPDFTIVAGNPARVVGQSRP